MRVLVTGGSGFIGSTVCRLLIGQGHETLNLDALTYAASRASLASIEGAAGYRFVEGDICDAGLVARLLNEFRPDAVLHLAAESHVDRSISGSAAFVRTNVTGTHVLLEAALRYWDRLSAAERARFRFLHVSTDEVFGSLGEEGVFSETTPYDPRSPYSATKAASDHLARAWAHTYGLPVIVTNCSNNYGPFQFPEKLIPRSILRAMAGESIEVYGDGRNVRDWLFVEDHASALALIMEEGAPGETYCIGGRGERANLTLVEMLCDLLDELAPDARPRRELIAFVKDRPGHDRRYAIDCTKIERELDWRPSLSLEQGLRRTVQWYLERRDWWAPLLERSAVARLGLAAGRS